MNSYHDEGERLDSQEQKIQDLNISNKELRFSKEAPFKHRLNSVAGLLKSPSGVSAQHDMLFTLKMESGTYNFQKFRILNHTKIMNDSIKRELLLNREKEEIQKEE